MKLKLVVASMSVLGLISCPAFAATPKHSKTMTQHVAQQDDQQAMSHPDYKGIVPVCIISQDSLTMVAMTQNVGRSIPNPCRPGWFNRISVSGGINVDFLKFGNNNSNFQGVNTNRFSLNDAYVNIAADVTDWAKAFASISYSDPVTSNNIGGITAGGPGTFTPYDAQYSSPYNGLSTTNAGGTNFNVEQAYMTIANYSMSPFFLQFGKMAADFSRYELHPITRSMTQVLSEDLTTQAKVGFLYNGFNGSLYAFNDPIPQFMKSTRNTNYGASLGFDHQGNGMGFDVGIAYVYNMMGAQDVADAVNYFNSSNGYHTRASAVALYGDLNFGPFMLGARYTAATTRFNPLDLPKYGVASTALGVVSTTASGAQPWAAGIQGGYGFNIWNLDQNVYLGYQASREAAGIALPKNRVQVGYGVAIVKYTNIGVEWDHDNSYSVSNGGNGNSYNLVTLRTSIQFS